MPGLGTRGYVDRFPAQQTTSASRASAGGELEIDKGENDIVCHVC